MDQLPSRWAEAIRAEAKKSQSVNEK